MVNIQSCYSFYTKQIRSLFTLERKYSLKYAATRYQFILIRLTMFESRRRCVLVYIFITCNFLRFLKGHYIKIPQRGIKPRFGAWEMRIVIIFYRL